MEFGQNRINMEIDDLRDKHHAEYLNSSGEYWKVLLAISSGSIILSFPIALNNPSMEIYKTLLLFFGMLSHALCILVAIISGYLRVALTSKAYDAASKGIGKYNERSESLKKRAETIGSLMMPQYGYLALACYF